MNFGGPEGAILFFVFALGLVPIACGIVAIGAAVAWFASYKGRVAGYAEGGALEP